MSNLPFFFDDRTEWPAQRDDRGILLVEEDDVDPLLVTYRDAFNRLSSNARIASRTWPFVHHDHDEARLLDCEVVLQEHEMELAGHEEQLGVHTKRLSAHESRLLRIERTLDAQRTREQDDTRIDAAFDALRDHLRFCAADLRRYLRVTKFDVSALAEACNEIRERFQATPRFELVDDEIPTVRIPAQTPVVDAEKRLSQFLDEWWLTRKDLDDSIVVALDWSE